MQDNPIKRAAEQRRIDPKTRYAAYIDVYCNIDTILWKNMGTVGGITALLFAIMGALVAKPEMRFEPLSHNQTVGLSLGFVSLFYFLAWWNFRRMRFHFDRMGYELRKLEPQGYFHFRDGESRRWWMEDAQWTMRGVFALGVFCVLLCIYFLALASPPAVVVSSALADEIAAKVLSLEMNISGTQLGAAKLERSIEQMKTVPQQIQALQLSAATLELSIEQMKTVPQQIQELQRSVIQLKLAIAQLQSEALNIEGRLPQPR